MAGHPCRADPNPLDLFRPVLSDGLSRRLLLIALLNAAPVAVTSTLFLFFVESRLQLPGWEGPLLLLFFLAAAASTPLWSVLARRHGPRPVLLAAMTLAIASFLWTLTLGANDLIPFALICAASGPPSGPTLRFSPRSSPGALPRPARPRRRPSGSGPSCRNFPWLWPPSRSFPRLTPQGSNPVRQTARPRFKASH